MFDVKKINWDKVEKPTERTRLLRPNGDYDRKFMEKAVEFSRKLMEEFLYLQDEYRFPNIVRGITEGFFSDNRVNLCYEMGDFQGVVGFTDIIPEYKCGVFLKIWDKELFGKDLIRELRELADFIMDSFQLRRMTVDTPDRRMVKFAKLAGFNVEGTQKMCFRWNGRLYTNYILSKLFEPKKEQEENKDQEGAKECAVKEKK